MMTDDEKGRSGGARFITTVPTLSYRDPTGSIVTVSNCYDFLGIAPSADNAAVRKACIKLLREAETDDHVAVVNTVRQWLKPEVRAEYDEALQHGAGLPMDMHEIQDGLFLGAVSAAARTDVLRSRGISVVLTVASDLRLSLPPDSFEHHVIGVRDEPEADILACLPQAFAVLDAARAQHKKVLVHCFSGVSRSATVCIAHMMKEARARQATAAPSASSSLPLLANAFNMVKTRRPCIEPNAGFMRSLIAFEQLGCPCGHELPPKATYQPLIDAAHTADLDVGCGMDDPSAVEQRRLERGADEERSRGTAL